uniref:hypothetical protein n=1 Tax=uncultured Ruminococcus sp. TaxID=165186 RepID=UPI0025F7F020|nr:hypothetical protein [uncultured Ruminococcus sp.]
MIDCSITENYFAEKARMTRASESKYIICKIDCKKCPLYPTNNGTSEKLSCTSIEKMYPEKAISIVQRWSDEHQPKTYLSAFLKNYPNAPLGDGGTPTGICPYELGLMGADDCRKDGNCVKCWNQRKEGE